jgi:hypothetical protein
MVQQVLMVLEMFYLIPNISQPPCNLAGCDLLKPVK